MFQAHFYNLLLRISYGKKPIPMISGDFFSFEVRSLVVHIVENNSDNKSEPEHKIGTNKYKESFSKSFVITPLHLLCYFYLLGPNSSSFWPI